MNETDHVRLWDPVIELVAHQQDGGGKDGQGGRRGEQSGLFGVHRCFLVGKVSGANRSREETPQSTTGGG